MKKIILILLLLSSVVLAQHTDTVVRGQLLIVEDEFGNPLINEYIDSARVETRLPLKVTNKLNEVLVSEVPPLPNIGEECLINKLYGYNNQVIICLQTHNRTEYPPEQTPALFNFYREGGDSLQWIVNELVAKGDYRWYNGLRYRCLLGHTTIETCTPPQTPTLWIADSGVQCSQWVQPTGAHDAYNIGDCVTFQGKCYKSLINANVWSPTVYPLGWQQITCP